jgi:hypothetical protein
MNEDLMWLPTSAVRSERMHHRSSSAFFALSVTGLSPATSLALIHRDSETIEHHGEK